MVSSERNPSHSSSSDDSFHTTLWGEVLDAGKADSPHNSAALARLCSVYWYPLYVFVRRQGHGPEDAKDLVQEFFARVLSRNYFQAADPVKGRFRTFLVTALKRFLADTHDHEQRQKRGGSNEILPFDDQDPETRYLSETSGSIPPERAFDRRWALTLLERTFEQLKEEYAADGRAQMFSELQVFLNGEQSARCAAQICQRLGMRNGTLRVTVHRLRQRYRELLRLEISKTVRNPADIDDEIRYLFEALG